MTTLFPTHRRCFTLIELLVIMMIFAILSAAMLTMVAGVETAARKAKTKDLIARLNSIVMARWNGYLTRRVPLTTPTFNMTPAQSAKARLDGLREMMRLELPQKYVDFKTDPKLLSAIPSVTLAYRNIYSSISPTPTEQYQGAECLYMVVMYGSDEGSVREQFKSSEIGDTDGDKMPEFWDGWDQPIRFLRWAPGFRSELQTGTELDPFDSRRVYTNTFKLVPLIYSPGPDGEDPIKTSSTFSNDPFNSGETPQDGTPTDATGALDNVHNHYMIID